MNKELDLDEEEDLTTKNTKCPWCHKKVNSLKEFKNERARQEFKMTGICQACQDKTFGPNLS